VGRASHDTTRMRVCMVRALRLCTLHSDRWRRLIQQLFDGLLHAGRRCGRREARHGFAPPVHEPFGEVPFDRLAEDVGLLPLQVHEGRVRSLAIHIDLGEHLEACPLAIRKGADIGGVSRFLLAELVVGEREDAQATWRETLVQLLELCIVPRREPSLARHIDNEADLAAKTIELDFGTRVQIGRRQLVK